MSQVNYILGNGALLSGIAAGTPSKIQNGTSEANVGAANGNININIGGTSNVVVYAATGEYVNGLISASGNVIGANIVTGGAVSASGNATAGNFINWRRSSSHRQCQW
jgi:hypothetical protein